MQIFDVPLNESGAKPSAAADAEQPGDIPTPGSSPGELERLLGHRTSTTTQTSVEQVYESFRTHAYEFVAVLDGTRFVGLCARREIGMLLGARYGFSLFARRSISAHMMAECLVVPVDTALAEVFELAFSRPEQTY